MATPRLAMLTRACVSCLAVLSVQLWNVMSAQQMPTGGVTIESVDVGSAGERGGLRVGDVVTSWTRAASPPANPLAEQGEITSPFDLGEIEIEQVPRGPVTLRASRAGARVAVEMPVGGWRITGRPAMSPRVSEMHSRARVAAAAGQGEEAVDLWRSAAEASSEGQPAVAVWLMLQAAGALRDANRLDAAQQLLGPVFPWTDRGGEASLIAVLEAQGQIYERQNDFLRADSTYRRVLEIRRRGGDESLAATKTMTDIAFSAFGRGDLEAAESSLRDVLRIQQKLAPGSLAVAKTFNNLGAVANQADDLDAAAEWLLKATSLLEQLLPNTIELAAALNNLGTLAWRRGELERAQGLSESALAIRRRLDPDSLAMAAILTNLGDVASDRGRLADSERLFRQALAIIERQAPGSDDEAAVRLNLGNRLRLRGDLLAAETHYLRSLAIREKSAPDSLVLATTLQGLGMLAGERGDQIRAHDYVERALALGERLAPDSLNVADTLTILGVIAGERGDLRAAETYHRRALAIKERQAPDSPSVAQSLSNLGDIAERRRDLQAARELYDAARELLEKVAPGGPALAAVLGNLGDVADLRGEPAEAVRFFTRALELTEQTAPDSASHAHVLRRLGLQALKSGDPTAAATWFERSIDALESQTVRLGGSDEVRAAFAGQTHDYYKEYIDTLLTLGRHAAAFEVLERSRARALLMVLAERDLGFDRDLPPEMLRRRQDLGAEYDRVQHSLAELKPGADPVEADRLRVKLRDLREARARIVESIRAASPRLASLQYPEPLDLRGAHQALDPGTVLLSYAVGKERTLLFVVERNRASAAPARVAVHELPIGEPALREQVAAFRAAIERHPDASDQTVVDHARRLFDALIGPALAAVGAADRVLISPDGPLHNLPFAALARPREGPPGAVRRSHQYLIEWKPIHTVVSVTVYAELKKARPARPVPATLVAFGDPRYTGRGNAPEQTVNPELRSAIRSGYTLEPLPATRAEVKAIAQPFGDRATTYLGAEATEERAKSVRSARYLHFATHGLLDARMPLNSALVLTLPEQLSENTDNGLLQAWEIFEQIRIDADLVTLSACETALGAELSGEGLVGLTRAFHYAGARSVMASLWSVADESTGTLMASVYRHLHNGLSKDEALRRAQLEAIGRPATSAPFHWAAFTLTGDWR